MRRRIASDSNAKVIVVLISDVSDEVVSMLEKVRLGRWDKGVFCGARRIPT